jgi:very-short-patch-repair endonuclease
VPHATVPHELRVAPFVGTRAVSAGLISRRQLVGPTWRRLFPTVYAWGDLALDHRAWCFAAALFLRGRGVVSGRDAATLWGADVLLRGAPVEVTVPHGVRFRPPPGLRVVRSRLPVTDLGVRAGVPVTTTRRTAFDLARRLSLVEGVTAVDAMLAAGLVTEAEIAHHAAARPGWPGLARVRKVLVLCDAGAESPQESRLRLILVAGRLPRPVTQFVVYDDGRFVARLDLAYPDRRLGVEYDGDRHRSRAAFRADVRRLNDLRACGWTVLRFVAADLYRPHDVVGVVRRALVEHV